MTLAYISRLGRFAEALEEEVIHHGSILQHYNMTNANLVGTFSISAPEMGSVPSMISGQLLSPQLIQASSGKL